MEITIITTTTTTIQTLTRTVDNERPFKLLYFVGEAAGLAMGLVMLGSFSSTAIDDMVAVSYIYILSMISASLYVTCLSMNVY